MNGEQRHENGSVEQAEQGGTAQVSRGQTGIVERTVSGDAHRPKQKSVRQKKSKAAGQKSFWELSQYKQGAEASDDKARFKSKVWRPMDHKKLSLLLRYYKLREIIQELRDSLKYCRQRILRGYCDLDSSNVFAWFIQIMPAILDQYKRTRHGSPAWSGCGFQLDFLDEEERESECHDEWDRVLDRMVFLLWEMDRETCSQTNPFVDPLCDLLDAYQEDYDMLLEEILSQYDDCSSEADLEAKYREREKEIEAYQAVCKDEFFELFSKWFLDMWD